MSGKLKALKAALVIKKKKKKMGPSTLSFLDPPGLQEPLRTRFGLQAELPLQLKAVNVAQLPQQRAVPIRARGLWVQFDRRAQTGPGIGALLALATVIVDLLLLRSGLWSQLLVFLEFEAADAESTTEAFCSLPSTPPS